MNHLIAAESYMDLMRSGAHWAFELTLEAITAAVAWVFGRAPLRRKIEQHDREHHGAH